MTLLCRIPKFCYHGIKGQFRAHFSDTVKSPEFETPCLVQHSWLNLLCDWSYSKFRVKIATPRVWCIMIIIARSVSQTTIPYPKLSRDTSRPTQFYYTTCSQYSHMMKPEFTQVNRKRIFHHQWEFKKIYSITKGLKHVIRIWYIALAYNFVNWVGDIIIMCHLLK